jgi:hypothetical protein
LLAFWVNRRGQCVTLNEVPMDIVPFEPLDERQEVLKRLGTSRESADRLSRKAAEAEIVLGIHGVSLTAGNAAGNFSEALRSEMEKHFRIHDTPTRSDPLHRTVELPKPLTKEIVVLFNRLLGREE